MDATIDIAPVQVLVQDGAVVGYVLGATLGDAEVEVRINNTPNGAAVQALVSSLTQIVGASMADLDGASIVHLRSETPGW